MDPTAIPTPEVIAASLFDLGKLVSHWNALLMVAVWTLIQLVRRLFPGALTGSSTLTRFMPLAPILLCCAAVWIPGPWLSSDETWGQRLVLGVVLGALTSNIHNLLSKLGLESLLNLDPDPAKRKKPEPAP